jgi:hypothetical protein
VANRAPIRGQPTPSDSARHPKACLMHAGASSTGRTRPIIRLLPASEISPDLVEEQGQVSEHLSLAMRVRKQRGESILHRSLLEIRRPDRAYIGLVLNFKSAGQRGHVCT